MTIREYDGILFFSDPKLTNRVQEIEGIDKILSDCTDTYCEISYSGRDTSRFVVKLLQSLASILVDADGEITCEVDNDGEISFEFYSIKKAGLYCEAGTIVRSNIHEVT